MDAGWLNELEKLLAERQVDLDDVLRRIVDGVTEALRADRGTLYLVDHATNELVSRVAHLPEITEIRLRIGEGVAGWVARTGKVLRASERRPDPRMARRVDAVTGYKTESVLAVPVRGLPTPDGRGPVVGVLQVLNKRGGDFDDEDAISLSSLSERVARLLFTSSLGNQLTPGQRQPLSFRFNHIVGESAAMREVYDRTARAARTDATVIVRGESGSGKELIARAIHYNSKRADAPFVKVDCAALPEQLIENELFGHERGAYTGADRAAEGKVHAAEGGTLFLDEVGELTLATQGKLLRLLQDRTFLRLGSARPENADVRFVCATHRPLEQRVADGQFRQDLYYRLRVVEVVVPPLRDRGHSDIDRLVDHFVFQFSRRYGRPGVRLAPDARAAIHVHPWPGNVRELEHAIESAVVLAPEDLIRADHLPLRSPIGHAPTLPVGQPASPAELGAPPPQGAFVTGIRGLEEVERAYIRHVLAHCGGNRSAAARTLGIGRNTLLRKLQEA